MSEQQFRVVNFRDATLARIRQAQGIIAEYDGQRLTARQIYYQFVARDLIPNNERSYKTMTNLLTDARYAGMIDWDAIEDRGREPDVPSEWDSIDEVIDAAVRQYRSPRWRDQPKYVELWVEKQALAGVLGPIARRAHVPLIAEFGQQSWELDALPPRELNRLVEAAIERNIDQDLMDAAIARENADRERVRAAIERSRE
jgi:hypothetical protein